MIINDIRSKLYTKINIKHVETNNYNDNFLKIRLHKSFL